VERSRFDRLDPRHVVALEIAQLEPAAVGPEAELLGDQ
jgi:hypothetical protein